MLFRRLLLPAVIGAIIGAKFDAVLASTILGAFVCAAVCWPLMKWAVAIMGGVVGAAIGASVWRSAGLDPAFAWAGAMTGLVGFGMLSFILFRGSIMMYTSLQGSVMLVFGLLGLIYKYHQVAPQVTNGLTVNALVMPMTILIPAIIGVIFQQANTAADGKKE